MKLKLTYLILFMTVCVSCKKTTEVDVSLSNSGQLSYKLTDEAGKGIPNVKVSLFDHLDNYYSNNSILIDERQTDANGQVDFGDLNPKSYLIVADSAKVNNVNYFIQDYAQVVTGKSKHKEIKVTDFSGTLIVKVTSYYTGQPEKNIGVFVISRDNYEYDNNVTKSLKAAEFRAVTNTEGTATLNIPSNKDYIVCIYNTSTNVYLSNGSVMIQKGAYFTYPMAFYQ